MVDVKISALSAIASVAGEDLVAIIDDPSVTPVSRKATIDQIKTYINTSAITASSTDTFTNKSIDLTNNTLTGTSLELKTAISDETGSGSLVFATSPTLVTPVLGTPSSGTLTSCTGLPITGLASGSSSNLAGVISDETGSGSLVFATSPTLVTPALGTPASGTLTNCTFPTLNQSTTGSSASCTGNSATVTTNANLTGDVTSTGNATAIGSGVIINADVNGSAAIAYSKLNLSSSIVTGDIVDGTITKADMATAAKTESLIIAAGDETTALTVADGKTEFQMPYAFTLTDVRATLTTAGSTSGVTTIDVEDDGVSIFSTLLTIDSTEKTSTSAATAAVISGATIADGSIMKINCDVLSGGATEAGLKIAFIGYQT